MKKKKIKKKIKWKRLISILLFLIIVIGLIYGYMQLHIKNIYVKGNSLLKENDILSLTNLLDYPKVYKVNTKEIEKTIIENPLVNKVKVTKSFLGKVTIEIDENHYLYKDSAGNIMLSNGTMLENQKVVGIPNLINEVVDVEDKFIKSLNKVDKDILMRISEIEYKPSNLDKERFMFYMTDGNYVYVTLSKMDLINTYSEVYPSLEGKKGILYLDSGNHFEIKKDVEKEIKN